MWWAEHAIMGAVFLCFAAYLAKGRNFLWLGAAALSQVPFWAGLLAFLYSANSNPVEINLAINLAVAGLFTEWGHKLQVQSRGGVVHIWIGVVFVAAASIDVIQLLYEFPLYVLAQEVIHYLALVVIGGRAYVRGLDGSHRSNSHRPDSAQGGRMV